MTLFREDIFGPALSIVAYEFLTEAEHLANKQCVSTRFSWICERLYNDCLFVSHGATDVP